MKAALAAGRQHKAAAAYKGEFSGAAQLKIAMAFLTDLANSETVSALPKTNNFNTLLLTWWDRMSSWSPPKLAQEILVFKISKPKVASKIAGLSNYMESQGGLFVEGIAPPSQRERKVSKLIWQFNR